MSSAAVSFGGRPSSLTAIASVIPDCSTGVGALLFQDWGTIVNVYPGLTVL